MEIAIIGGSFNPPTNAHAAIMLGCLELAGIDEVWVMPSGNRADKRYGVADTDRLNMLKLTHKEVFNFDKRLKITGFEIDNLPQPTQTWQTVKALQKHYPNYNFWFVFGDDSYFDMPRWQNGRKLQKELKMLIVPRNGQGIPVSKRVKILRVASSRISSTEVRERSKSGKPIGHMVCDSVRSYIGEHELYLR